MDLGRLLFIKPKKKSINKFTFIFNGLNTCSFVAREVVHHPSRGRRLFNPTHIILLARARRTKTHTREADGELNWDMCRKPDRRHTHTCLPSTRHRTHSALGRGERNTLTLYHSHALSNPIYFLIYPETNYNNCVAAK